MCVFSCIIIFLNKIPVLRSGKSGSYFDILGGGCCGILYGCELGTTPAGNDSPEELFTTPLRNIETL